MADSSASSAVQRRERLAGELVSTGSKDVAESGQSVPNADWFGTMTERLQDWDRRLNRLRRLCALLESEGEQARSELWALAASTEQLANAIRSELDGLTPEREKALLVTAQPGGILRLRKLRRDVERLSREHASVCELMQDLESEVSEWGLEAAAEPAIPSRSRSGAVKSASASHALERQSAQGIEVATSTASESVVAKDGVYGTFAAGQGRSSTQAMASALETGTALQQARLDAQYAEHDLQERQTLLQRIQSGVQQAHTVFRELTSITESQQQPLNDIEARTQQVRGEQELTALEWERYVRRRRSRRRFCFWFSIWATLVLLFAIYVFLH
ncbi:hypothetical protein CCYA_CCYA05G1502 [Cyanidiococcus yangmingshanensis]|nr:hypothetical protein CCYA_CCYA05G1502 [Cyanidiococcus yangmingshanensis]